MRRRIEELLDDPRSVAVLEDHDLLYASATMLRNFDFLRRSLLLLFPGNMTGRLHHWTNCIA